MIDVNALHVFIDLICDKWQQFTFDSVQKDVAINAAQKELFAYYDGLTSQYQPGNPQPVVGYEQNLVISNELEPFKDYSDIAIPGSGKITQAALLAAIQADLSSTDKLHRITNCIGLQNGGTKFSDCQWKRSDRIGYILGSSFLEPDLDNPVYINTKRNYQFYPANIASVRFNYLLLPPDVQWGFDMASGRPVYNSETSKQCFFKETSFHKLIFRALFFLGLNISEEQVIQASAQMKTEN